MLDFFDVYIVSLWEILSKFNKLQSSWNYQKKISMLLRWNECNLGLMNLNNEERETERQRHIETERDRERQRETEWESERERLWERQTESERETNTEY
jgi:hypothetical protein